MKAATRTRYGPPEVIELRELDKPSVAEDEVLVRVRAVSVNAADWYTLNGPVMVRMTSGLRRPKTQKLGTDYAGTVEAAGANVTKFRAGDEVFGGRTGAYAEFVTVPQDRAIAPKPENMSFEEAAALPIAAVTALQGLRDKAKVQPGQKVLVNGASGGVGTYAVQIAKALGAEVTAVCSTPNVDVAQSLGADHVIDYTRDDFTRRGERYDVLCDVAGSRSWSEYKRVLAPDGVFVVVGAPRSHPLRHVASMLVNGRLRGRQKVVFFVAKIDRASLDALRELAESGKLRSVIDRRYDLDHIADAYRYFGAGHARGKIVVTA
jgi:NADPH:quinone reductase-like Zn-dependent oxidoreductase